MTTLTRRSFSRAQRDLLNGYYLYLKGKRYSKSTIRTYIFHIADLVHFYKDRSNTELNNRDIEHYIEAIYLKRHYAISTQRQFISALKLFIKYFPDTHIEELELVRPDQGRRLPVVLSKQEIIDLIRHTRNLKHRAVVGMLYSAGLRISELINLELKSIDVDRRQIFIRDTKGRRIDMSCYRKDFFLCSRIIL